MTAGLSFGRWLRQRRRMLDFTQRAFADLVGCACSTLRRIEAGDLKPSKELALIFLDKLGIPESERPEWIHFARGLSNIPQKSIQEFIPYRRLTNLPTSLTSFIGRENEQAQITGLIARHRLVTLIGQGGVGKTRLALESCQKLADEYPGSVWFIALDSLSNPALVPQTVASIFDIREGSDRSIIERLIDSLYAKTTLLILDNCEHLLEACVALIKILLANCPKLKILVTSRETLGVAGEALCHVPPLASPQENESFEKLNECESIRLFHERAKLIEMDFALNKENASVVAQICLFLEGIPLAIELAAARADILQTHEILGQLKHSFDLLVNNERAALSRHQTMRASMDWSWGLLRASEQTFMRQLSVFAGGWTLESSQAVCDGDALNLLSALAKKSLIVVDQETGRETRYRFHEIVRQYMYEKLVESGDAENIRMRHLKYFLQLAGQAEIALRGPEQMEWYTRLRAERDNIRAALEQAENSDVETGLYISGRLGQFWEEVDLVEGVRWLKKFTQKQESRNFPHARATALCQLAWSLQWLEESGRAQSLAQECLDLYRTCGDKFGEVDALTLLGTLTSWESPSDMEFLQQALQQARSLKDVWRQAHILSRMGQLVGSNPRRVTYWEKAISLYRKAGDFYSMAGFMIHLAYYDVTYGNFDSARMRLDSALLLNQQKALGAERNSYFLSIVGRISSINGNYKQARACLQAAVHIAEEQGHRMNVLWNCTNLGYHALREGNITEARDLFAKTAQNFQHDKDTGGVVFTVEGMASLYIMVGKLEYAARLIGWADATRKKISDTRPLNEQADVDKIITACLMKMGEVAFSDAYEEGQKMTLDEAVALALPENQLSK